MKSHLIHVMMSIALTASCATDTQPTRKPTEVSVSASAGWQDAGVSVRAGQAFELTKVNGTIRDLATEIRGGNGSDYVCGDAGCCEPMPHERRSALIGRIGSDVFLVGNRVRRTAPSDGPLFLRVNDCDEGLHDNVGTLHAQFIGK